MLFSFFRGLRRRRLAKQPMPAAWEPLIESRLPFTEGYAPDELQRFRLHLKVFALEKDWVGVHGLVVTDEMKVIISGAAARLARNLDLDVYEALRSMVIYPAAFQQPEGGEVRLGEAHRWGQVILSWDSVKAGLANPSDGRDTAVHELAHVLDAAAGIFDGTPTLHRVADYQAWAKAFSVAFEALRERPHRHVLRPYGATNEAEFFAVATEAFFEKPLQLRSKAPELYAELKRYYRVDPARRITGA
ncbi:MAG: zinc-dependent peptidase [Archangium sp.]|nr:zinc-dependent peptidase [Archangium sp.]